MPDIDTFHAYLHLPEPDNKNDRAKYPAEVAAPIANALILLR
ncbi:Acetyltransferase, GNAT family [Yersinia frederiksenii ATCC 33641]|nr:Acetyltransferase, GNAT family [Yersinia frederiksenii ATCC 33641]